MKTSKEVSKELIAAAEQFNQAATMPIMAEAKENPGQTFVEATPEEGIGFINGIEISIAEYSRLKDIETRFTIMREQMLNAEYCPIHTQIILGIEKEYEMKKAAREFMQKDFLVPTFPEGKNNHLKKPIKTDLAPDALHKQEDKQC